MKKPEEVVTRPRPPRFRVAPALRERVRVSRVNPLLVLLMVAPKVGLPIVVSMVSGTHTSRKWREMGRGSNLMLPSTLTALPNFPYPLGF